MLWLNFFAILEEALDVLKAYMFQRRQISFEEAL